MSSGGLDCDVLVLGSGFAGSLTAIIAHRLGRRVCLLERGAHPRFAIGESTSPLTNLLLEELSERYDLPRIRPLSQWGTWKRTYPDLPVGLKRGFSFYHHTAGRSFQPDPARSAELLVAASPSDELADTHWRRAEFDEFLAREAEGLGVEHWERTQLDGVERVPSGWRVTGSRDGRPFSGHASYVVDASGPRGALARLLRLPAESPDPWQMGTCTLYSHFTGVRSFAKIAGSGGDAPYPPDRAALHHVFEGGWIWVLPFDDGVVSAGIAADRRLAAELRLAEGEPGWRRVLARFPSVGEHFAAASSIRPFTYAPCLAWDCRETAGDGWLLLPSAVSFIDPLFSTGFVLTLLGISRLVREWEASWQPRAPFLRRYGEVTRREAAATARLVRCCYQAFSDFESFAALSMLYFAAASFSEMSRRLGTAPEEAEFLLGHDAAFSAGVDAACGRIEAGGRLTQAQVAAWIRQHNIAGLADSARRNWYPVDLEACVVNAHRLGVTPDQVRECFASLGLAGTSPTNGDPP